MTNTQQQRHESLESWLRDMDFVLKAHRFIITTGSRKDRRGYGRTYADVHGENWNGHILFTPAFPTGFVTYITETVRAKIDEFGQSVYKIGYGKLASVYAAYKRSIDRKAIIDEVLKDLDTLTPI